MTIRCDLRLPHPMHIAVCRPYIGLHKDRRVFAFRGDVERAIYVRCLLCSLTQESMLMCRDRSRSVFNAVASKSGPKRLAKMFANFIFLHVGMPDEAFSPTIPFCLRGCFCLFAFSRLVELVVGLCCFVTGWGPSEAALYRLGRLATVAQSAPSLARWALSCACPSIGQSSDTSSVGKRTWRSN